MFFTLDLQTDCVWRLQTMWRSYWRQWEKKNVIYLRANTQNRAYPFIYEMRQSYLDSVIVDALNMEHGTWKWFELFECMNIAWCDQHWSPTGNSICIVRFRLYYWQWIAGGRGDYMHKFTSKTHKQKNKRTKIERFSTWNAVFPLNRK